MQKYNKVYHYKKDKVKTSCLRILSRRKYYSSMALRTFFFLFYLAYFLETEHNTVVLCTVSCSLKELFFNFNSIKMNVYLKYYFNRK